MKLGEFFINLAVKGDTNKLKTALSQMQQAEKRSAMLIKYRKDLAKATTEEEKSLVKRNFAQKIQIENYQKEITEQNNLTSSISNGLLTATKWIASISLAVVAIDRLGNSLLKANQQYITFGKQTGISISNLNRMSGLARLSGMNLSPEQVAGDLQGLQQRIFRLGLTGEGSGIFAQLGINPLGMKSDQFIKMLRGRTQGMPADAKSYVLDQLGLSQEWLNVLELTNEQFADYVRQSKELQLSESERKELAKYTAEQQKNNMRWELAKQKLLIQIMPLMQEIMEFASKIALHISKSIGSQDIQNVLRDASILMGLMVAHAAKFAWNMNKALLSTIEINALMKTNTLKNAGTGLALASTGAGVAASTAGKGIVSKLGAIGLVVAALWTIYDLVKPFFVKEEAQQNQGVEAPIDPNVRYDYNNFKTSMINHFHNNPQPTQQIVDELATLQNTYLMGTTK